MKVKILRFLDKSMFQDYFVVILVILVAVSPLLNYITKLASLLLILFLVSNKFKVKTNYLLFLLFFSIFFFPSFLVDMYSLVDGYPLTGSMMFIPLSVFVGLIISMNFSPSKYIYISESFIFITAILSLVSVMVFMISPSIVNYMFTYEYGEFQHKTILIFNVLTFEDQTLVLRNTGIASEPGLYQLILHLGLWMHLKFSENVKTIKVIVYIVAILFTFSTVGLLLLLIVFLFFLKKKSFIAILFVLFTVVIFSNQLIEIVEHQIDYKLIGSDTFIERFEPFINVFTLSGTGWFGGLGSIKYTAIVDDLNIGAWDSFGQIAVRYGYFSLFLFCLLSLFILFRDFYLFCILLLTTISQSVWFFAFLIPFYIWAITGQFIILQKIKLRSI